jgi:transposase-like protein
MAQRIDDAKRARIVAALEAGGKLAQIARAEDVSPSSVKLIRSAAGLAPLPTPEAKVNAAQARDVMLLDARRRRADLMVSLLSDAERLRQQLFAPALAWGFGGKDYEYTSHEITEPDFKGKQALMIATGIAIDKSLQLEKYDQESTTAAKAAIIDLVDRLTGSGDDLVETPSEEET